MLSSNRFGKCLSYVGDVPVDVRSQEISQIRHLESEIERRKLKDKYQLLFFSPDRVSIFSPIVCIAHVHACKVC